MPGHKDFGVDLPEHYGKLYTVDENGKDIIEVVASEVGDYARVYDGVYDVLKNGKEKIITDEQTLLLMDLLEKGLTQEEVVLK